MKTKWMMDPNQSDILIKMRHSIVAYMTGTQNKFDGYVEMKNNEIEAASVEFLINVNNNETIYIGYFFGGLPIVKENFSLLVYAIIGISLMAVASVVIQMIRSMNAKGCEDPEKKGK